MGIRLHLKYYLSVVPKPKHHDDPRLAGPVSKIQAGNDVVDIILVAALFEAVDGDVDLVHPCVDQGLTPACQQGAVGGDLGLEAQRSGDGQHPGQLRVGQGLAHEMVVEVAGDAAEFPGDLLKFRRGHHLWLPEGAGAEGAISVAKVGDFHINPGIGEFLIQNSTLSFHRGGW